MGSGMNGEEVCRGVHELLAALPAFEHPRDVAIKDGLYFFYEGGESSAHAPSGRVVRIGNHPRSDGTLVRRLRQHYQGRKNGSVFRKFVGGALMRVDNRDHPCLAPAPGKGHWERQNEKVCDRCRPVEQRVSRLLRTRFRFRCVAIQEREERNTFEELLIATLTCCRVCRPLAGATCLFGHHSRDGDVEQSVRRGHSDVGGGVGAIRRPCRRDAERVSGAVVDTLCFVPCCKSKAEYVGSPRVDSTLNERRIPETWASLLGARKRMSGCIEGASASGPALSVYDGGVFKSAPGFREEVNRHLNAGHVDLYVLSAGYGVVHALDPIQLYEAEMKRGVAALWREAHLVDVVSELIAVSRARRVFGFFAGPSRWNRTDAMYRYFFTEGLKAAIGAGAVVSDGRCFHREEGMGVRAINGALGRTLLRGLRADFSKRFLAEYKDGQRDGNVLIRTDTLH